MTAYDRLDLLFQQNNGIVKTAQVLEIGIAKSTFYLYRKRSEIFHTKCLIKTELS